MIFTILDGNINKISSFNVHITNFLLNKNINIFLMNKNINYLFWIKMLIYFY